MILRNPLPDPNLRHRFNEVDTAEIPVVRPPDTTRVPLLIDRNINPCPYWHAPEPKPSIDFAKIDYEKIAGRILLIGMGLFTLLISLILLYKVLILVIFFK